MSRPFGVYVHVPYCVARCGYCDFNTYVAPEAERDGYAAIAVAEVRLAARELGRLGVSIDAVETVFFGGGTPTLLSPEDLGAILGAIGDELGLAPGAEVTTEANPESVDERSLAALRDAGITRVSFGMQSAAAHVLAVLDRVHTPGRAVQALHEARAAGFEHVSADLIYGTPGESDDDWRASLEAALSAAPDHVSAYSLIVEPGTALAARVRRGELPAPDDDVLADRYAIADDVLTSAGLRWYEVSNWATGDDARCRHNLGYWGDGDWWAIGPGAHGHLDGVRWWNVRRPAEHARMVADGRVPEDDREVLTAEQRATERVMLGLRLADGLPLRPDEQEAAGRLAAGGLLDPARLPDGRAVLTRRGRLLADHVTRILLEETGPALRSLEDRAGS